MLTKVGLRTMVINLKQILTSLFIWAVTAVAAQNIEIVVHRGANALAPENTWPSAEAALQYGAKWIEVDVRKSKDGVLFNLHDETLDRTTNGKGLLADMMSEDVRTLDAGSWFGPQFAGLRVPTIAEMLDSLDGKSYVFFDVKRGTPIPTLVKLVREKGFADKSFFWFGDEVMLREFITLAPEMKIKVNAGDIDRLKYRRMWRLPQRKSQTSFAVTVTGMVSRLWQPARKMTPRSSNWSLTKRLI